MYNVKKFTQYLLGRKFKLYTDHKPLLTIFYLQKGIPGIAANRQRWAETLSAYDYEIHFQPFTKHGNADDALSRLPLDQNQNWVDDTEEIV